MPSTPIRSIVVLIGATALVIVVLLAVCVVALHGSSLSNVADEERLWWAEIAMVSAAVLLLALVMSLCIVLTSRLRRAERGIVERERRLEDILEIGGDWVWETDANHLYTFISERFQIVTRIDRSIFIGKSRRDFRRDHDSPAWRDHLTQLSAREPFQNFQYVFDHPDGQPRHFRVNGKPVFDDAGEFQGYRGTGRDVTEEIEAQREVQKQTLLLEATLEHMAQGISVVGPDLKALAFNRRFLEMLEFPPEQFSVGDSFAKFIRYNIERGEYGDGPVEDIVAEKVAQAREFKPHKFERKRPNGLVMEVEGRPLPGGGFVTTYTDVTERHHTAERLVAARTAAEAANTAKTMFLANMSHELRTPLNGVIGFAALLAEQRFGQIGERYVGYALDIKNCGEHLLAIINDILDLAKVETGAAEHRCEAIGFRQAAAECLNLMSSQASRGQIALSNDVPVKGDTVWADPRFLRQILLNLISNAIKFSEPGGQVSVAFEARQGATVLHVVDQGIGISEEDLEHVFEPFVQVGSGYDRKYEGTGLGLALVRRLVDLHGGDISIDSTLGEGTTVTISLPLPADVSKRADQKLAAAGDD